jgi:hypothetical protein
LREIANTSKSAAASKLGYKVLPAGHDPTHNDPINAAIWLEQLQ